MYHEPALLRESIEGLAVRPDGVYLDGTLGGGGHFRAIAAALGPQGTAIGIDRDADALAWVRGNAVTGGARIILEQSRFSEFESVLDRYGVELLDGAILDLGVSSHQINDAQRGFSYQGDGPLDMRMDGGTGRTAEQLLRESDVKDVAAILAGYGEVRSAARMARVLCEAASRGEMTTTLAARACLEREFGSLAPSVLSQVYQALRIAVNGELDELRVFLERITDRLAPGGRLAVISYHSLEDRLVKNAIRDRGGRCVCPPLQPVCTCGMKATLKRVSHKAIQPSEAEVASNRRSRSARLRTAERIA